MRCEGTRRDGGSCGAQASPGSIFCQSHEDGRGRALRAIDEGRDPRELEATVAPGPAQGALFAEEDLPADPVPFAYDAEPVR